MRLSEEREERQWSLSWPFMPVPAKGIYSVGKKHSADGLTLLDLDVSPSRTRVPRTPKCKFGFNALSISSSSALGLRVRYPFSACLATTYYKP